MEVISHEAIIPAERPSEGYDLKTLGSVVKTTEVANVETIPENNSGKDPVVAILSDSKEDPKPLQATIEVQYEYIQLLEERLSLLEERVGSIESDQKVEAELKFEPKDEPKDEPEDEPEGKPKDACSEPTQPQRLPAIPKVRRVNFADFKSRYCEGDSRYAIEVLVAGAHLKEEIQQEQIMRRSKPKGYSTKSRDELVAQTERSAQVDERWPQRIRIQSWPVLTILAKVVGESWPTTPRTFFRPFRILIYFQGKMKEILKELESKWSEAEIQEFSGATNSSDAAMNQAAAKTEGKTEETPSTSLKKYTYSDLSDQDLEQKSHPDDPGEETPDPLVDSVEALRDMRCYVNFIDKEIAPLFHQFERLDGTSRQKIRFSDLWYLFRVGEIVYTPMASDLSDGDSPNSSLSSMCQTAWRVSSIYIPPPRYKIRALDVRNNSQISAEYDDEEKWTDAIVWCYYIDYNGKSFGAVEKDFDITYFDGERDIRSLDVYPIRFAENHERVRKDLKEQGEKFQTYLACKHLYYNGSTITWSPKGQRIKDSKGSEIRHPEYIDSNVIVDFVEAFQTNPGWRTDHKIPRKDEAFDQARTDNFLIKQWSDRDRRKLDSEVAEIVQWKDDVGMRLRNEHIENDEFLIGCRAEEGNEKEKKKQVLRDEDLILLPRRLFAYVLRDRKFAPVDVRYLRQVAEQLNAFDSLKLPGNHKNMVQALVDSHFVKKRMEKLHFADSLDQDIVQGKGRGLIILLHGVPGVGKTSTAECVAQEKRKPLFAITCGDLGFTPSDVESSLSEIFRLAHLWDCVLLLDEADVFLSQRSKFDLKRNALVSVFLRILEYYNGILFLTTNRVGSLDEAFKSRIHVSLYYPPLEEQQTKAIWEMNLERTKMIQEQRRKETKEPPLITYDNEILEFAIKHFKQHSHGKGRWNGRQIRNAFQIALSLAYHDMRSTSSMLLESDPDAASAIRPELRKRHFKVVAKATLEFDKYMNETAGKTDAERAFELGDRADHMSRGYQGAKMEDPVGYRQNPAYSNLENYQGATREDPVGYGQNPAYSYHDNPQNTNRQAQNTGYLQRPNIGQNDQEMGASSTMNMSHETPPPRRGNVPKANFNYNNENNARTGYTSFKSDPVDDSD